MEEKKAAAAPVALLERLIDRVPYFDGSGRRRLVTGVVFSLGAGLILWHTYRVQVSGISFKDMLESPVSVILSLLVLFAIGGLVEMIGEFFLVRAASGIVWSTSFPKRFTEKVRPPWKRRMIFVGAIVFWPVNAVWEVMRGLAGRTGYEVPLVRELTAGGERALQSFPERVRFGLLQPTGEHAEFAQKHLLEKLASKTDRDWGTRLFSKARDLGSYTTTIFLIVALAFATGLAVGPSAGLEAAVDSRHKTDLAYRETLNDLDKAGWGVPLGVSGSEFRTDIEEVRFRLKDWMDREMQLLRQLEKEKDADRVRAQEERVTRLRIGGQRVTDAGIAADKSRQVALEAVERERAVVAIRTVTLLIPLLFLYVGFFTSLRTAIISVLECIAIRSSEASMFVLPPLEPSDVADNDDRSGELPRL